MNKSEAVSRKNFLSHCLVLPIIIAKTKQSFKNQYIKIASLRSQRLFKAFDTDTQK